MSSIQLLPCPSHHHLCLVQYYSSQTSISASAKAARRGFKNLNVLICSTLQCTPHPQLRSKIGALYCIYQLIWTHLRPLTNIIALWVGVGPKGPEIASKATYLNSRFYKFNQLSIIQVN